MLLELAIERWVFILEGLEESSYDLFINGLIINKTEGVKFQRLKKGFNV